MTAYDIYKIIFFRKKYGKAFVFNMSKTYCISTHEYSFSHLKVRLSTVILSVFLGLNPCCIKNYVLGTPKQ